MIGFLLGWMFGCAFTWAYFIGVGLIRSRSEYYARRRAMGKKVPDDWEEDY